MPGFMSYFPLIFLQPGESAHRLCALFRSHAGKGFHSTKVVPSYCQFSAVHAVVSTSFLCLCPTRVLYPFSRSVCIVAV